MESLSERWRRLRTIIGRSVEDGLGEEIRFHIEQQTAKNIRHGRIPPKRNVGRSFSLEG